MPCEDKLCLGKEVGEEDCVLGVRKPGKFQHKNPWKVAENVFHPLLLAWFDLFEKEGTLTVPFQLMANMLKARRYISWYKDV